VSSEANLSGAALAALLWLCSACASAHDLLTAEAAERYLAQADRHLAVLKSKDALPLRAEASYALGRLLDEVRDLLNRDLAAHGRLQGLPTEYLVGALQGRGVRLQVDRDLGRYPANLRYYRDALALAPDGVHAGDAELRLLQGYFYDSFTDDPLQPRAQSWRRLQEQILTGERFLHRNPQHAEREEAEFILAVHYVQAARSGPDSTTRFTYAERARRSAADFRARHPDSMRVAAIDVLMESLPARGR
jgi:tetratricopeptide (TPR) repeat protein